MRELSGPVMPEGNPPGDPAPVTPAINTERLSKRFNNQYALRNITLRVMPGDIYCLFGAGSAGKTTLLKLLLGFLHPDSGTIQLLGSPDLTGARSHVGYLPQRPRYHENFTGLDYLRFQARLAGYAPREARQAAERAVEAAALGAPASRRISSYSREMRQRFGLAVALVGAGGYPPKILLLDEPGTALDPEGRTILCDVILECRRLGSAVLVCSRHLTEIERTATRVGILRAGLLVAQDRVENGPRAVLTGVPREGALEIAPHLCTYLRGLDPRVRVEGGSAAKEPLVVSLPAGPDVPDAPRLKAVALRAMIDAYFDVTSVYTENKDLETLYIQAVQSPSQYNASGGAMITTPLETEPEENVRAVPAESSSAEGPPTTPLYSTETKYTPIDYETERDASSEEDRVGEEV